MPLELTIEYVNIEHQVNIGSSNGLVPSGTKPLPVPMLIQFYVAIWCH